MAAELYNATAPERMLALVCDNAWVHEGLTHLLGPLDNLAGLDTLPAGPGILLLVPGGSSTDLRIRMLSLVASLRFARHWQALNLIDERCEQDVRFARLTGVPSLSLRLAVPALKTAIIEQAGKARETGFRGAASLTAKQWQSIRCSLYGQVPEDGLLNRKTLYTHRQVALHRLEMRNMLEMRRVLSAGADLKRNEM